VNATRAIESGHEKVWRLGAPRTNPPA
jgi:hypothetical protein